MKYAKKLALFSLMLAITVFIPSVVPQHHVFGKMLLPMHLAVMIAAYITGGPLAMVIGAISPYIRHSIVGMPAMTLVIPMSVELAVYGLVAGVGYSHSSKRGKSIVKSLLVAMVTGRIVFAAVNYFVQASLGNTYTFGMMMTDTVGNAIPGIIIQLFVVTLIAYNLKKAGKI